MIESVFKLPARVIRHVTDSAKQRANLAWARQALAGLSAGDYFVKPAPSPHITQWASPDLVSDILDGKISARDDPRQKEFGFKTRADYDFLSWRICGLMCVKAVLDAYAVAAGKTVADLTLAGAALGGYDTGRDKGWFYAPLIKLATNYGLSGQVYGHLSATEIAADILNRRFVIASAHPDVIRGDLAENPRDGKGHLVLVWGFRWDGTGLVGFYIQNPSGRQKSSQVKAFVPIERFLAAFAGRGFWLALGR